MGLIVWSLICFSTIVRCSMLLLLCVCDQLIHRGSFLSVNVTR